MTIKFLTQMIEKMPHPDTGKEVFELSHWNYSSELPYMALRTHLGFYESYEKAESEHVKQYVLERFKDK